MSRPAFRIRGDRLLLEPYDDARPLEKADREAFSRWIGRYRRLLDKSGGDRESGLLELGREIYGWLEGGEQWMAKLRREFGAQPFCFELAVKSIPDESDFAFLEVPWELLADDNGHLAADAHHRFSPIRQVGDSGEPDPPDAEWRLLALFMAAAPEAPGISVLDFEREETAILSATAQANLELVVEETGDLAELANRVAEEHPVHLLHLSCHGLPGKDGDPVALALEDDTGALAPATADQLAVKLGSRLPRLLFLSAYKSAEPDALLNSLSTEFIRYGCRSVLGWGGSVRDTEATRFAATLYEQLALAEPVELAVARARTALLIPEPGEQPARTGTSAASTSASLVAACSPGKESPSPGGPGTRSQGIPRRQARSSGRRTAGVRREAQIHPNHHPDLSRGRKSRRADSRIGGQGKSSLAARIANRYPDHQPVVVFGHYSARDIVRAFEDAYQGEPVTGIIENTKQAAGEGEMPPGVFTAAIRALLDQEDLALGGSRKPFLLILDDYERVLDAEQERIDEEKFPGVADTLRGVILAFAKAAGVSDSRLLITCRFRFRLPDEGADLIEQHLFDLHLSRMSEDEGLKQARAQERLEKPKPAASFQEAADARSRVIRCVHAARGNPRLQNLLFGLARESPAQADDALDAMEAYLESGDLPDSESGDEGDDSAAAQVQKFLEDTAVEKLVGWLKPSEQRLLAASTLFELPVPEPILLKIAAEIGVTDTARLETLGCWEPFPDPFDPRVRAMAINPLVRPKVADRLSEADGKGSIELVLDDLFENWGGKDRKKLPFVLDIELTRLAVLTGATGILDHTAEFALRGLEKQFLNREASALAGSVIRGYETQDQEAPPGIYRAVGERLLATGDQPENARAALGSAVEIYRGRADAGEEVDALEFGGALLAFCRALAQVGSLDEAMALLEQARAVFGEEERPREWSIATGQIARIKVSKGEIDEALALHEQRIEVFRSLGDKDGIANELWSIGELAEKEEDYQKAVESFDESLPLNLDLGRIDGIGAVGMSLGILLFRLRQGEQARQPLEIARQAWEKLGRAQDADLCRQLLERIEAEEEKEESAD